MVKVAAAFEASLERISVLGELPSLLIHWAAHMATVRREAEKQADRVPLSRDDPAREHLINQIGHMNLERWLSEHPDEERQTDAIRRFSEEYLRSIANLYAGV